MTQLGDGSTVDYYEHKTPDGPIARRVAKAFTRLLEHETSESVATQNAARALNVPEDVVLEPEKLEKVVVKRD